MKGLSLAAPPGTRTREEIVLAELRELRRQTEQLQSVIESWIAQPQQVA